MPLPPNLSRFSWSVVVLLVWSLGLSALAFAGNNSEPSPKEATKPGQTPSAPLQIGSIRCGRVLYLGNSITLHGPAPQIGWTGNWGMAATSQANDYVHLLTAKIADAAKGEPKVMVKNIADFERNLDQYDIAESLKAELAFKPELVILAIGENAAPLKDAAARERFRKAVDSLLKALTEQDRPTILVRSCFWADPAKDAELKGAATLAGATFVDIHELGGDPSMAARSERKIEHDGVAGHPGDKGMKAIADAIWKAIETAAKSTP